jgi:signal transduction histidine kinase
MSETIDDFRLFFSPEQKKDSFDLVLYLKHAINIVLASLNYHHIEVVVEGEEKTFFALGTPNEFAQAVLNLLNNARDALSKQEEIKRKIHILFRQEERKVAILFCDNGGGIPHHILPKIFEPFITGNLETGGSGAGLYITRLIIEQKMAGTIDVYNTKHGACFKILV